MPQSPLTKQDVRLDASGDLYLTKVFPPGLTLARIGFRVNAHSNTTLTFIPKVEMKEFSVATLWDSPLKFYASGMQTGTPKMLPKDSYRGIISTSSLINTQKITVNVFGLPKGRSLLWIIGLTFVLLFFMSASILCYRTHNKALNA